MSAGSTNRQVDKSLSSYVTPITILSVTFGTDGGDDILIVQLDDFAVMVPESDPAALEEWIFLRYVSGSGVQRVDIDALEPQPATADGSVFWLRMAAGIGEESGAWSLSLPMLQQYVRGQSGGKLHAALDVDGGFLPPDSAGRFTTFVSMGNALANNWTITGVNIVSGNDIDVSTDSASNSPFTIISSGGWVFSAGNGINSISDQGSGVLRLTLNNTPASGDMVAIVNSNPDVLAAGGRLSAASFGVL